MGTPKATKNEMILIDIWDFFTTGDFGPIRLGMTRNEIIQLIGEPDDYGYPPTSSAQAGVWKYGDIEFHFGENLPRLFMIWCDHIPLPGNKSQYISLNAGLLANGGQPSKQEFEEYMNERTLGYKYLELEQTTPGELTLFFEDDSESLEVTTTADASGIHYQSAEISGMFILESGVEISLGNIYQYYRNQPPTIQRDRIVSIGYQNLEYYGK